MIAIIGHIDVDPADRDRLVATTVELQRATATDEPGCVVYTMAADPTDPGRIRIVELWDSEGSLVAHFEHPNFFATGDVLRSAPRLGGTVAKYRIDAVGPIRGADGVASATYWPDAD
ncbi:MAG TPA: antibiotic biosynthesis monooxygenase family protein [Ilumatobacteraceae bacterium]|nr:antibiotic biosynthesis monooxygenase family protein [Ilumatobacteraceae bacterium]